MSKSIVSFECPKCSCAVDAIVDPVYLFVLYKCPKCRCNVVSYEDKVDVISDKLILKLLASRKFKLQSSKKPSKPAPMKQEATIITEEQIEELRHLMATEKDFDSFLKKL